MVHIDAHIWLIHYLFLPSINQDAEQWARVWNNHVLARRGEEHRTPNNMYLFGMIEKGRRGVHVAPDTLLAMDDNDDDLLGASDDDYAAYGIDWDDLNDHRTRDHHNTHNREDGDPSNPFVSNQPDRLSHVNVPCARCPFNSQQIQALDDQLARLPYIRDQDMNSRRLVWIDALRIASQL